MPDKLTPEWDIYEDDYGQEVTADTHPEEIEPTTDANHNYVSIDIMIPHGSEISRG